MQILAVLDEAAHGALDDSLKTLYKQSGGQYVLDIAPDEAAKLPSTLATQLENKKTELTRVHNDKNALAAKVTAFEALGKTPEEIQTAIAAGKLPKGTVAVPESEYNALKTDVEAYKALGNVDEIKPKVEGYDTLLAENKRSLKDRALTAAGVTDMDMARNIKTYDEIEIEAETKDGKEIFQLVTKDAEGKETKTEFNGDVLKEKFEGTLGKLVGAGGTRMFRQSGNTQSPSTPAAMAEDHMKNRYKGIPQQNANQQ